jgi:hypothetical protein
LRIVDRFIFIRRIPISEIPRDTEGCSRWIHKLYQEKDEIFDYFNEHDTFEGNGLPRVEIPRNSNDLLIELGWIILIGIPSIIYLIQILLTSSFLSQFILIIIICIGMFN